MSPHRHFVFLGSNPKNREKTSDTPEKEELAVRGSNAKKHSNSTRTFTSVAQNLLLVGSKNCKLTFLPELATPRSYVLALLNSHFHPLSRFPM
jgi:hypothetical protein